MSLATVLRRSIALLCLPWGCVRNLLSPGLRILMYHRVSASAGPDQLNVHPTRFEAQMAALARGRGRVLALDAALDALDAGQLRRGDVVVTFDDGYLDNLTEALPILQRHGIPATIFVTTGFCDQRLSHPRYPKVAGQGAEQKAERLHLTWPEVRQLAATPGMAIGSHTVSHPYLSRLSELDARHEITHSREQIAQQLGQPVSCFCYPSGDATAREQALVAGAGYRAAVTVAPGVNRAATPRQALRRTEVTDRDTPFDLWLKLHGAYDPVHTLLHWRRVRRFARAAAQQPSPGNE
jgi:peptidoglycan/xylan/chitin deacetylase (PgdA/CDA1 family)